MKQLSPHYSRTFLIVFHFKGDSKFWLLYMMIWIFLIVYLVTNDEDKEVLIFHFLCTSSFFHWDIINTFFLTMCHNQCLLLTILKVLRTYGF
jgi:hypothetical protein